MGRRRVSGAVAIPDPPSGSSVDAVRDYLGRLAALRQLILANRDVEAALEMHRRLEALARYVGDRQAKKDVLGEDRRTEIVIGKLLGDRPGSGRGHREKTPALEVLHWQRREEFRRLAEHEDVVERMIEDRRPERPGILAEIEELGRLEQRARAERIIDTLEADLRLGDFRTELGDLVDVDAVITDPPYGGEFVHLFGELGRWAAKVLRPGGVLAVMTGQYHLPAVIEELADSGLPYRWTLAYATAGQATRIHPANLATMWKPVLLYGGRDLALGSDIVTSDRNDKAKHRWGQSENGMANLVERITRSGWHIVDPFTGGGTTGTVALRLGRRFTGCEVDPAAFHRARRRLDAQA